ncbi:MAG TPA: hypothetical protein VD999_06080 [Vitreimonas sp.]|nr:hypothetical protein [Vitreimonas sp.]
MEFTPSSLHSASETILHRNKDNPELNGLKAEFDKIFANIEQIGRELVDFYVLVHTSYGLNPGKVRLYMVGGRVIGKPLKETSDIDLVFQVEHPTQSAGTIAPIGLDTHSAMDAAESIRSGLKHVTQQISQRLNIKNHFHINNFGQVMEDKIYENKAVLIAKSA